MTRFCKKIIQIFSILIVFLSIVSIINAQNYVTNSISSISLVSSPANPRAGESVTISIFSDSLNLSSSKINWYVDGTLQKSSETYIVIKNKINGDSTLVRAVVETNDGVKRETTKIITSGGVDLVIEPIGYTMPFYKGKPVFLAEGTVKIVAMPDIVVDGNRLKSSELTYRWSKGGTILGSNSGKGKDSVIITSTIPVRDITIGLEVLDNSGNVLATAGKIISKNTPSVLLYEKNSLLGVLYNKAITNTYDLGSKEEITIVAKPFSFSFNNDISSEANYVWYANRSKVTTDIKNQILLKQTGSTSGATNISISLNNINKMNQYASNNFTISFGN